MIHWVVLDDCKAAGLMSQNWSKLPPTTFIIRPNVDIPTGVIQAWNIQITIELKIDKPSFGAKEITLEIPPLEIIASSAGT